MELAQQKHRFGGLLVVNLFLPHLNTKCTVPPQEGVSLEIAEAVIGALRGDLAATAVNAPMVPAEVLFIIKE